MRCFGLSLALASFTAAVSLADDKPEIKKPDVDQGKLVIRWYGQSFFQITTSKGTKIVIDPHGLEQYRMNLNEEMIEADLVLISHPHSDHSNIAIVKGYKDPKKVKQIWAVKQETRDWNIVKEEFKDVKIQTVGTYHDTEGGMKRGKNGVFIIEVDGMRLVHMGDLGHVLTPRQVKNIKPEGKNVDVLMIPVGGVYTINGLVAKDVVGQLEPTRNIIPMHYGTVVYSWLLDLKQTLFLDGVPPKQIEELKINKLVIDPKAEAPKEPKYTILHFFDDAK